MPSGLTIGTERANALQQSIQDELTKRGYSPDADPVMAEYITIMIINNKTSAQITSELEDLIGSDFNSSFTDWLFEEAAKGAMEPDVLTPSPVTKPEQSIDPGPSKSIPTYIANDSSRNTGAPRNGIYQQALSQALPSSSNSSQKRTASARSPSPTHPNKSRRTDLPTGPRAMYRDGSASNGNPHPNPRSLLDRVGGPAGRGQKNFQRDEIQARIDNIVSNTPEVNNMMMPPNFPGMGGMDMNAMAANMSNPLLLQEMMMSQMAMMAQMASSLGIINPATGGFGGQGFPMQGGMPNDMGIFPNGMNNGFPPQQGAGNNGPNGGRGDRPPVQRGRGQGRDRGGFTGGGSAPQGAGGRAHGPTNDTAGRGPSTPIVAPTPITPTSSTTHPSAAARAAVPVAQVQPNYAVPERPQSPTLCKFALKCTNAHCRYSHPSPVATAESGVVLSNEACEKEKECKDKDCIKAHVSPAVLNPQAAEKAPPAPAPVLAVTPQAHHAPTIPCRFGASCTRPGCTFSHPQRQSHFATQCRFGAGCTRAQCAFQHPEGRVLPSSFHRGLATTGPIVNVPTPETGSMGANTSQNRSMTFNNPAANKEKLQKQIQEIQEKKTEAEKAVKDAEAAANKKTDAKPVSITA